MTDRCAVCERVKYPADIWRLTPQSKQPLCDACHGMVCQVLACRRRTADRRRGELPGMLT